MKQLVICSSFPFSTHTFITREIAETLDRGHDVVILSPVEGDEPGRKLAQRLGIGVERIIYADVLKSPVFSFNWQRFTHRISRAGQVEVYGRKLAEMRKSYFVELLKNPLLKNVDIIHSHFIGWSYELAMPLSELLGVPFTCTAHNSFLDKLPHYYFEALQDKSLITFPSKSFRDIWVGKTQREENLHVVPNAVAVSEFLPTDYYLDKTFLGLITVSRLTQVKRIADALYALHRLHENRVFFHYTIVGSGPEEVALRHLAASLNIGSNVTFLGNQPHDRVITELQKNDICIHPSENESFGVAVVEAMAAGLPVVAARSGGTQETVVHGETGLLYQPGDIDALTSGLIKLAGDVQMRASYGRAGSARVNRNYTWDGHMKAMCDIWNSAISEHLVPVVFPRRVEER